MRKKYLRYDPFIADLEEKIIFTKTIGIKAYYLYLGIILKQSDYAVRMNIVANCCYK